MSGYLLSVLDAGVALHLYQVVFGFSSSFSHISLNSYAILKNPTVQVDAVMGICVIHITCPLALLASSDMVHLHCLA